MNSRVVVIGINQYLERLLGACPDLWDEVETVIDDKYPEKTYRGKTVNLMDALSGKDFKGKFVITSLQEFNVIHNCLVENYLVSGENIITLREWLANALKNTDMVLKPQSVRMEACTLCQLNCVDCYMRKDDSGTVGKGYLKYKDFKEFVDQNDFIKEVELSNSGEVFLNPELHQILAYADKKQVRIKMENGVNFNDVTKEQIEALVKYHVWGITFSIDGASQEIYAQYRRNGNFETVINNIKLLNCYKEKYKTKYPLMKWQYILFRHNEKDVLAARKMAEELGMEIVFKLDWNQGNAFTPKNPELLRRVTGLSVFDRNEYRKKVDKGGYNRGVCKQLIFSPQINWDGRLLGCCAVYKSDWGVNVFENSFLEIINGAAYRKTICELLENTEIHNDGSPCVNCSSYLANINSNAYITI